MVGDLTFACGKEIEKYIEELGRFRIEIFKEYPYIYDGDMEYEKKYLGRYARCEESFLLVVDNEHGIDCACTGIPLKDELPEFQKPFLERDIPIDKIFYLGEVMVRKNLRGQGLGTRLMDRALTHVYNAGLYEEVVLATVIREPNHPLRPADYIDKDNLWRKFGFEKLDGITVSFDWKDIGEEQETTKEMVYWRKQF